MQYIAFLSGGADIPSGIPAEIEHLAAMPPVDELKLVGGLPLPDFAHVPGHHSSVEGATGEAVGVLAAPLDFGYGVVVADELVQVPAHVSGVPQVDVAVLATR